MLDRSYVLLTAARNEATSIAKTIDSVLRQTVRPAEWVIVSDASTDGTDDIVRAISLSAGFIRLVRVDRDGGRSFGAKAIALDRARAGLSSSNYGFLGVLDADISFAPRYFESLLAEFDRDPSLGVAGGVILQWTGGRLERRIKSLNSVAGAVQLFRRECFFSTDGFPEMEIGGEDAAIEIQARMQGWRVRTFPQIEVIHYGRVGEGSGGRLGARYEFGQRCFLLGYHPLFQAMRLLSRAIERPYIVGSVAEMVGFVAARLRFKRPSLKPEIVRFLRREQIGRLGAILRAGSGGARR